jgi:hypothetical protein
MQTEQAKKIEVIIENSDVFNYRRIRRAIGYLAVGLPVVLVLFSVIPFFKTSLQSSISHFYYTNLRELFTGTLCAVGLFMVRYRGFGNEQWWKNDNLLTNIAGVMAFGVALIPTFHVEEMCRTTTLLSYDWNFLGWLHYFFAAGLFISISILSIHVFTIGQENEPGIPKSAFDENNIYKICGYSIIVFIIMIPISEILNLFPNSTLVLEALSLFAFGTAWLIKGRALGQTGKIGEMLYREHNTSEETDKDLFRKYQ